MMDLVRKLRAAVSPALLFALLLCAVLLLLSQGDEPAIAQQTALEARINQALSGIEGAGEIRVVIRTRKAANKDQATAFMQTDDEETVPCGALVVAKGADDPLIRMKLTQALCALLGLNAGDVDVLDM